MWDLPGPGIKPVSPALASGFLTTAPTGESRIPMTLTDKWKLCSWAYKTPSLGLWHICGFLSRYYFPLHPALPLCHLLLFPFSADYLSFMIYGISSLCILSLIYKLFNLPTFIWFNVVSPSRLYVPGRQRLSDSSFCPDRVTQGLINICSIQFQDLVQLLTSFCHSYPVMISFSKHWKHFCFMYLIYRLAHAAVYCCLSF